MGELEEPGVYTNMRFGPGRPDPPRTFRLYDEGSDTLLTEGTYASGTVHYPHPVPVSGYESKTILFRADTSSNLMASK